MSYSRWSNSYWYTFWAVSDDTTKEGQIFDICTIASFTYKELTENMDKCIERVREEVEDDMEESLIEELKGYMKQFIKDVDEDFNSRKLR